MTEFKNRITGLEYIEASELVVHPQNWREHPEDQRAVLEAWLDENHPPPTAYMAAMHHLAGVGNDK